MGKQLGFDNNRTYGIEIECILPRAAVAYNRLANLLPEGWIVKDDCSLHGYIEGIQTSKEIVSPVLKGEEGFEQLEIVCSILESVGAEVNRSCGLHVHHDARDYDLKAWKTLIQTYAKYEGTIDTFMPEDRRENNNRFCRKMGLLQGGRMESYFNKINSCQSIREIMELYETRYHKLNVKSYMRHGTVEFRQHHGSVSFTEIKNWVVLTQGLVTRGAKRKVPSLKRPSNEKWFESLFSTAGYKSLSNTFYRSQQRRFAV